MVLHYRGVCQRGLDVMQKVLVRKQCVQRDAILGRTEHKGQQARHTRINLDLPSLEEPLESLSAVSEYELHDGIGPPVGPGTDW